MRINWKKFVITFSLLVLLVIAVAFIARHFSDHRKYIINDLPADDAIYDLLTDEVISELTEGQIKLLSSEHVLLLADGLQDANNVKAGKVASPEIQVGTWEMELVRSGTNYRKGDTLLFFGPPYLLPTVTLTYTERRASAFSVVCTELPHKGKLLCATDLTLITNMALREKIFVHFLSQFRELTAEVTAAKEAAQPMLINIAKDFRSVDEKVDKTK